VPSEAASTIRSLLFACAVVVVCTWTRAAHASDNFPDALKLHWDITTLPVGGEGCRLCDNTDTGGLDDLNRYLGYRLKNTYNVRRRVQVTLTRALDQIEIRRDDSDGDGATDYEEIVEDRTNPSDPNSHRVFEVPSEGGAGGEAADVGGASADGGEPPSVEYPPAQPLPELPPPIWHGCTLSTRSASGLPALGVLAIAGGLAFWRRRVARR
jgi:hypothetical protein